MSRVRLKDVCASITDGEHGSVPATSNSGYYLLSAKNIIDGKVILGSIEREISQEDFLKIRKRTSLEKGDILITTTGTIGNIGIVENCSNYDFNRDVGIFKCKTDVLLPRYLYYVLLSDYVQTKIRHNSKGGTQKHIYIHDLEDIEIELPEIEEQKRVLNTLGKIDDKIHKNREINDYLCSQIQFLFSYLFNLSNAPKSWDKGVLSDIANITMGQSPSGDSYNIIGKGCPFYQGSTDFGAIFPTMRMYTDKPSRYAKVLDTLLSVRAPVGSLNIAYENCCIGRGLASIHGKYDNNTFVRYLLKNNRWYFDNINNSGTTFGSITKNYLFEMPITIPDGKLVSMFEQKSSLIEQQIYKNEQQIRELSNLRDWLLPMLMNGQATIED
ncbi:restriction endonuclease subunit S [Anaerobutyricum soehngenii]|uniref:restriction endonuclease subunit S n=2 Tax=Anaerobutyricum soehngenii TaxID=105843 RepID=UPI003D7B01E5